MLDHLRIWVSFLGFLIIIIFNDPLAGNDNINLMHVNIRLKWEVKKLSCIPAITGVDSEAEKLLDEPGTGDGM